MGQEKNDIPEEPAMTVISAVTSPGTTAYNTPAVRTPKDEKEVLDFNGIPVLRSPRENYATFNDLDLDEVTRLRGKQRRYEYFCLFSVSWALFLSGWGDATNGPLIPRMQEYYHINYTIVSMIYIPYCAGYIIAASVNLPLLEKLGFGTTLVIGAVLQAVAYAVQSAAPPFPAFAAIYVLTGFGVSLQAANSLAFSVKLGEKKLGILAAAYGVGAMLAPLSATKFATLYHWSFHYFVSLGGAIINIVLLVSSLRFRRMDVILQKAGQVVHTRNESQSKNMYSQLFRLKAVHILAIFALLYTGAEVAIGGWIVTFMETKRGGGPSSGYIATGYWGGLTLGRLILIWVTRWIGERRVVYVYVSLAIGLELIVWLVPSLIGDAVAIALIGFFLGPIYSILTTVAERIIPHWLLSGGVGWYGGIGQAGAALFPFVTGALASKFGIMSLQPLAVALLVTLMVVWSLVPPDLEQVQPPAGAQGSLETQSV